MYILGILSVFLQYFPVQFNKGEHGYDNQALDMKPFFRAVGPDFQRNLEVGPFETVNINPLMCHLLKITPEPNDGHLNATRHMLTSSIQTDSENIGSYTSIYLSIWPVWWICLVFQMKARLVMIFSAVFSLVWDLSLVFCSLFLLFS